MKRTALIAIAFGVVTVCVSPLYAGDADNTARNARDSQGTTLLPTDQGNSESDVQITKRVRQAVVANDALSINAKNVKIIAVDGIVTLRGPVASLDEKATIGSVAAQSAGVKRVDNQLEVAQSN